MPKFRNYARSLFITVNGLVVVLFLLACANGFLPPGKWWLVSLLGLAFPYLFLFVACFLVVTVLMPALRRWSLLSLAALLIGWTNIRHFIAFHPGDRFLQQRQPGTAIRILTWNVRSFDDFVTRKRPPVRHRAGMLQFIGAQQADILCLQEFYEALTRHGLESNLTYIREQLHYPYYYFSRDYTRPGLFEAGVIIFSRFPIVDSSVHAFAKPYGFHTTESLISADIVASGDTIRVYTTHLQSVLFGSKEFRDLQIIRNVQDSIVDASRSIVRKLRDAFRHRGEQAVEVRSRLDSCPYPAVICGDFNDVPNSYTYATIRGDWQDAWLQKGFGIGRTYKNISPTLRIDYILPSPKFKVVQCRKISLPWSDHNPVEADLQLAGTGQ